LTCALRLPRLRAWTVVRLVGALAVAFVVVIGSACGEQRPSTCRIDAGAPLTSRTVQETLVAGGIIVNDGGWCESDIVGDFDNGDSHEPGDSQGFVGCSVRLAPLENVKSSRVQLVRETSKKLECVLANVECSIYPDSERLAPAQIARLRRALNQLERKISA